MDDPVSHFPTAMQKVALVHEALARLESTAVADDEFGLGTTDHEVGPPADAGGAVATRPPMTIAGRARAPATSRRTVNLGRALGAKGIRDSLVVGRDNRRARYRLGLAHLRMGWARRARGARLRG